MPHFHITIVDRQRGASRTAIVRRVEAPNLAAASIEAAKMAARHAPGAAGVTVNYECAYCGNPVSPALVQFDGTGRPLHMECYLDGAQHGPETEPPF